MEKTIKKELSGESSIAIIPRKAKTIKLQGKDYAQVSDRVAEFHKIHKNGSITTVYDFNSGWVIFTATIVIDVKQPDRIFKGTSLGKAGAAKAFEKLETIAVGRALAFAGFLSDGEIASSEEMDKYQELVTVLEDDEITDSIVLLESAHDLQELGKIWRSFSQARRDNPELLNLKNSLKAKYENTQSGTKNPRVAKPAQGESNGDGVKTDSRDTNSTEEV